MQPVDQRGEVAQPVAVRVADRGQAGLVRRHRLGQRRQQPDRLDALAGIDPLQPLVEQAGDVVGRMGRPGQGQGLRAGRAVEPDVDQIEPAGAEAERLQPPAQRVGQQRVCGGQRLGRPQRFREADPLPQHDVRLAGRDRLRGAAESLVEPPDHPDAEPAGERTAGDAVEFADPAQAEAVQQRGLSRTQPQRLDRQRGQGGRGGMVGDRCRRVRAVARHRVGSAGGGGDRGAHR